MGIFGNKKKQEPSIEEGFELVQDMVNIVTRFTNKNGTNVYLWGVQDIIDFSNAVQNLGKVEEK